MTVAAGIEGELGICIACSALACASPAAPNFPSRASLLRKILPLKTKHCYVSLISCQAFRFSRAFIMRATMAATLAMTTTTKAVPKGIHFTSTIAVMMTIAVMIVVTTVTKYCRSWPGRQGYQGY